MFEVIYIDRRKLKKLKRKKYIIEACPFLYYYSKTLKKSFVYHTDDDVLKNDTPVYIVVPKKTNGTTHFNIFGFSNLHGNIKSYYIFNDFPDYVKWKLRI